ncbi:MAG TPA: efflux RND transporter periplasmic adaptor subunit [Myxococcales bacterium]|nr:efflux RND transporter periplasmic adaptor subunit [Myxococcales bacterium]
MSAATETLTQRHGLKSRRVAIAVAAIVLLVAFLAGYLPRRLARAKLAAATPAAPVALRVSVVKAAAIDAGRALTLPAGLVADSQTLVYARANGYVRRWLVDIGDKVKKGQLLVVLDTPELDQQLAQSRALLLQKVAALAQAKANRDYARITARREAGLFAKLLISAQENDQAQTQATVWEANVNSAEADVVAQRANVRQLEQLVSFGKVYAPYDGTITRRLVDVGTLVNAGAGSSAAALFEIATIDPMEAYVDVPQPYAPSVRVGSEAKVAVRSFRGHVFTGRVTRTAGALDPASRTLRTEVTIPNPNGELLSGMYVDVTLDVAIEHQIVRVPSSAIIADSRGVHVAVVDASGKVHLVAVTTGHDDGTNIDVVAGLSGGEQVIATPPSGVADGMQVQAVSQG